MTQKRLNKRECPHCHVGLGPEDDAGLQRVIERARSSGGWIMDEPTVELSCGHKAAFAAVQFQNGAGFWVDHR